MSELFLGSQLELSTFTAATNDDGTDSAPHVAPPNGHILLEKFADLSRFLTGDPALSDVATQKQLRRALKLVTVLWGPLPTDIDPGKKCVLRVKGFSINFLLLCNSFQCIEHSSY